MSHDDSREMGFCVHCNRLLPLPDGGSCQACVTAAGWRQHGGGPCPVNPRAPVEIETIGGERSTWERAEAVIWERGTYIHDAGCALPREAEVARYRLAPSLIERLSGPHEWGYRDPVEGGFVVDDTPFKAAEALRALGVGEVAADEQLLADANDWYSSVQIEEMAKELSWCISRHPDGSTPVVIDQKPARSILAILERLRTPSPVLEVAKEALEPFATAFDDARERYVRRYGSMPVVGQQNFDAMPDAWPMEELAFTMGDFRRALAALQTIGAGQ